MVEAMPHSRREFEWALSVFDDPEQKRIDRALAFHVLCHQGIIASPYKKQWHCTRSSGVSRWQSERVERLAERIWRVQLECKPAPRLLAMLADTSEAVIYCDPPYPTSDIEPYGVTTDYAALSDAMLSQAGFVAVSGYKDEWDHLGWHRYEKESWTTRWGEHAGPAQPRTEVIWTNREVSNPQLSLFR